MTKSYHSSVVPIELAAASRVMLRPDSLTTSSMLGRYPLVLPLIFPPADRVHSAPEGSISRPWPHLSRADLRPRSSACARRENEYFRTQRASRSNNSEN